MSCAEMLNCPICGWKELHRIFEYTEPPTGEIRFKSSTRVEYFREVWQCKVCNHFLSKHKMDLTALYSGDYVNSNYRDLDGIRRTFERIVSLDAKESDNAGRVKRIAEFVESFLRAPALENRDPTLLDVGSGLSVFPHGMRQLGWKCTALDSDERLMQHAREHVGVNAIYGDFMKLNIENKYDAITFNKVLEHVGEPISMLKKSLRNLLPGGFVYVEVPDGEMAAKGGKDREEFYIDHIHIFSFTSLTILVNRARLVPVLVERLKESSTKYTLRAFLISR